MADARKIQPQAGMDSKLADLTDFEIRVWWQYVSSANDVGVMPATASVLQAGNRYLAKKPAKMVQRALERIVAIGLLQTFEHDGVRYCWNVKWQDSQEIRYPRRHSWPLPPAQDFQKASDATRELFAKFQKERGKVSETFHDSENLLRAGDRARAPRAPARNPNPDPNPNPNPENVEGGMGETGVLPLETEVDSEGLSIVAPVWSNQPRSHGGLVKSHRACHSSAAVACGRGVCVPAFLVDQWLQQTDDVYVRNFVGSVIDKLAPGPVGDDPLPFWRAQWQAVHGSAARPARFSRHDQSRSDAQELLNSRRQS